MFNEYGSKISTSMANMAKEVKITAAKYAPPPSALPVYRQVDPATVTFVGKTNYEAPLTSKKFIFGITRKDRRDHVYVIGKAGMGKSHLLETMIRQDIAYGYGVCVIDPDGELVRRLVDFVPEERVEDVLLIDFSRENHSIRFNPLKGVQDELQHHIAQGFVEVMERRFDQKHWTSQMETVLRSTVLAVLDFPDSTIQTIVDVLTDADFRARVVERCNDEMVRRFFTVEFESWRRQSERFVSEVVVPLVHKLNLFLSARSLKAMFSNPENSIDFFELMRERRIVLINLAKGKLGDEHASFLGSLFITKIRQAVISRASLPERERKDFYLYVDEFHSLVAASFVNLFTEARKAGLSITVSHQYIAQLHPGVFASILGSIANFIFFRLGGDDAAHLEPEMAPVFKAKDMINLGVREFYIKEMIDGHTYDPFSAETLNVLPPPHRSFREEIIEASRKKYGSEEIS